MNDSILNFPDFNTFNPDKHKIYCYYLVGTLRYSTATAT